VGAIFQARSYSPDVLSVPFVVAMATVVAVILYVSLVRGVAILRLSLLLIAVGILLFVAGLALVASTHDEVVATWLYRFNLALLPLASSGVLLFLLALAHRVSHHRVLVAVAMISSAAIAVVCAATDLVIPGVWRTPSGMLYFRVDLNGVAQLHPTMIGLWVLVGIAFAWRRLTKEASAVRRRQLKGSIIAFSLCALGLADVPLAYGVGWYPISWLFLTVGLLLALRLLVAVDLIGAVALDRRVPLTIGYVLVAAACTWLVLRATGPGTSVLLATAMAMGVFTVLRITVALVQAMGVARAGTDSETPLDRAIRRYVSQIETVRDAQGISRATVELIDLGLGCKTDFLVPSRDDYSWERLAGEGSETLPESETPDPLVLSWLLEHARPLARDEIDAQRLGDLRGPIERLFDTHGAEHMVPLVNRDEVVGMLTLGALKNRRALRSEEVRFLLRAQEHAAAALVYARMHKEATARVEVDKEVGLAAAVQRAFIPKGERLEVANMSFSGLYAPASRCGGDWWSVHGLPRERVLVLIGDVTGHGIPAAMVTAAAKGCYDVAQRLMGGELDVVRLLDLLDASVRRAGGRQFYMTCFATLLDPPNHKVTFANAGHVVPYLCRPTVEGGVVLDALVARGNPLGATERSEYRATTRDLASGDILIWYTDGIVECTNPQRRQFGDRRMQRVLRRIEGVSADVQTIRNSLVRAAVAFQEGQPADDDITLVVGRVE